MASEWSNRGAKRAREARADLGHAGAGPLPDVLAAIEGPGRAHVLLLELPAEIAGAHIARPGLPLLLVNGRQALSRQRFTLAHEFGHHRMGHATVVDGQDAISGKLTRDRNEVCANAFAAEFLMPRAAVAAWASERVRGAVTLEDVLRLAHEYGVSAQAGRYALETAGALRDRRRARQLDDEIADEMHFELARWLGLPAARRRAGRRRGDAAAHPARAARQRAGRLPRGRGGRRGAGAADGCRSRRGARDARGSRARQAGADERLSVKNGLRRSMTPVWRPVSFAALLLVSAVVVALATAFAITSLRAKADDARVTQTLFTDIARRSQRGERPRVGGAGDRWGRCRDSRRSAARSALSCSGHLRTLARLDADDARDNDRLRELLERYESAVDDMFGAIAGGHLELRGAGRRAPRRPGLRQCGRGAGIG